MHRVILGLADDDPRRGDHINGNTLDNRRSNLRLATIQQNNRNRRKTDGASRFKGVSRNGSRWQAYIGLDGKPRYLGTFATEEEAARAYDIAALEHFGAFARTNAELGLYEVAE